PPAAPGSSPPPGWGPATSTPPRSPSAPSGATPTSATGAWTPTPTRSRTTPAPPCTPPPPDLHHTRPAPLARGAREDRPVLDELTRLRDQGLVIGLSASGPAQAATIRRALELTTAGKAPFACVRATGNLLEPSAGPA